MKRSNIRWFYSVDLFIFAQDKSGNRHVMGHYWNYIELEEQVISANKHLEKNIDKNYQFI